MTTDSNILGDFLVLELSVLINSAYDVENNAAANIYIQVRVYSLNFTVSYHFYYGERVLVVPSEHSDTIG